MAPEELEHALAALRRLGKLRDRPRAVVPLTGGVSSDIVRIDADQESFCVKRALRQLKVEQEWLAPTERNAHEVAWYREAAAIVAAAAPQVVHHEPAHNFFIMRYLPPERFRLWKNMLRDGEADVADAHAVGDSLAAIHSGTAHKPELADTFANHEIFHAIRLHPYLEATAERHPDLAEALHRLIGTTAATRLALMHGDVSPKNILLGPEGPVFLDAECACWGDPAFDLAFCLNHLLLKCLWTPAAKPRFLACFEALTSAYLSRVDWEPSQQLQQRTAQLLPGLLLARIDGKSPVEYLTDPGDQECVRSFARAMLTTPVARPAEIAARWSQHLEQRP